MASVDTAPYPDNSAETCARCAHTRRRIRLDDGGWERDAKERLLARLGSVRAAALGTPDLSANPARSIWSQSAVLYDRAPLISHPLDTDGTAAAYLSAALEQAGVWPLMQRTQRKIIGLREMFVRVDVSDDGELLVRAITPDLVSATPDPNQPDRPLSVREMRRRESADGKQIWTLDIVDPRAESYTVQSLEPKRKKRGPQPRGSTTEQAVEYAPAGDVTESYLGAPASGEAYPYRLADGTAVLPYVLYHAAKTGCLYDAFDGIELVEGTYEVSTLWTFWGHCARDASWPQRWGIGVQIAGATQEGGPGTAREALVTDPATVVMLVPIGDLEPGVQPQVGQWEVGADPEVLANGIFSYESRLPTYAGGNPADFTRTSGDPRSGYALAISREGQRSAARRYEPTQRLGDVQLLMLCAAALNRWAEEQGVPLDLPEKGWQIRYVGIPRTDEEQRAIVDTMLVLLDKGLVTKPQAYAKIWDVSEAEAILATTPVDADAPEQAAPLNGAQVDAVVKVVSAVAMGQLPRDAAISILATAISVDEARATRLLGSAGAGFRPAEVQGGP